MRLIDILGLLLVQVLWGFHWSVVKIGLQDFPPLMLMAMRFTLAAALLVPFFRVPRDKIGRIARLSVTFGTLTFGLMYAGVAHLDAGTAAVIAQAQVPFAAVLAACFHNERFGWRRAIGLALSFLGIVLLIGEPRVAGGLPWVACILGSALAAAVGNLQIKNLGPVNSFALTGWVSLVTAPQMLLASLIFERGQWDALAGSTWHGWSSLGYSVLVVSIATYCLWYPVIRRYPVNQVMPFTLLVPVFGVLAGILALGEHVTLYTLLGGIATIGGVAVIVLRRPAAAP